MRVAKEKAMEAARVAREQALQRLVATAPSLAAVRAVVKDAGRATGPTLASGLQGVIGRVHRLWLEGRTYEMKLVAESVGFGGGTESSKAKAKAGA